MSYTFVSTSTPYVVFQNWGPLEQSSLELGYRTTRVRTPSSCRRRLLRWPARFSSFSTVRSSSVDFDPAFSPDQSRRPQTFSRVSTLRGARPCGRQTRGASTRGPSRYFIFGGIVETVFPSAYCVSQHQHVLPPVAREKNSPSIQRADGNGGNRADPVYHHCHPWT